MVRTIKSSIDKIMHRSITTNSYLHKCRIQLDNLCILCIKEAETIEHYFSTPDNVCFFTKKWNTFQL